MANTATVIGDGRTVVTTAGTRVQLATSEPSTPGALKSLAVTALSANTGTIVVGGPTCVAAVGTRRGTPLAAGDTVAIDIAGLTQVYLDATVNGEGVSYTYSV